MKYRCHLREGQERCIRRYALIAARNARFHSSLQKVALSTAKSAIRSIDRREETLEGVYSSWLCTCLIKLHALKTVIVDSELDPRGEDVYAEESNRENHGWQG